MESKAFVRSSMALLAMLVLPAGMTAQEAEGGTAGSATQVAPVPDVRKPPPIDLAITLPPLTPGSVNAGGSSTSAMTVWNTSGDTTTAVALSCSVQPSPPLGPTCSITPKSVTFPGTATLTVSTVGPSGSLLSRPGSGLFYALWLPLIGLVTTGFGLGSHQNGRNGRLKTAALACALLAGLSFQLACGSGGSRTPAGSYTITVTGAAYIPVVTAVTTTTLTVQ